MLNLHSRLFPSPDRLQVTEVTGPPVVTNSASTESPTTLGVSLMNCALRGRSK